MSDDRQPPWRWTGGLDGLTLGPVLVSFQRSFRAQDDVVDKAPRSFGALPAAAGSDGFLVPLSDEESLWLGITIPAQPVLPALSIDALRSDGRWAPVAVLDRPQTAIIAGTVRSDGRFDAFCRALFAGLRVTSGKEVADVHFVDPATYAQRTGEAAPAAIDASAAYGGWRLP